MKKSMAFTMRKTTVVLIALLALPGAGHGQSARRQVEEEINRITKGVESNRSSTDEWKQLKPYFTTSLAQARKAAQENQLLVALEILDGVHTNLQGAEALGLAPSLSKEGMEGFNAESARTDLYLKALEQRYMEGTWTSKPLALRAIAEADQARTRVLFDSGRGFAVATAPKDGLFYLGQSRGAIEFALFCQSLQLIGSAPEPPLHSMAADIRHLGEQILAAYKPPRSVEQHGQFIRINSALKESGDLEAAHLYAGALYKYLDSLEGFGALDEPVPGPEKAGDIRQNLAGLRRRLADGKYDHSIAEIFLQRAEIGLDAGQSKEDFARGRQRAQVITDQVIPAYFAALEKPEAAPASLPAKAITVTLVRWPYT